MYHPLITEMRQFYSSIKGKIVARAISHSIAKIWIRNDNDILATYGFVLPFIENMKSSINIMSPVMGAIFWPADGLNRTILAKVGELPLLDSSFNRIIIVHELEYNKNINNILNEVWRVLTPNGRALLIIPRKRSIWAKFNNNPFFINNKDFKRRVIYEKISKSGLTFVGSHNSLFTPPLNYKFLLKISMIIEFIGEMFFWFIGGVEIIEVEKQIYASIKEPVWNGILKDNFATTTASPKICDKKLPTK